MIWYYYQHKKTLNLKKLVLDQQSKRAKRSRMAVVRSTHTHTHTRALFALSCRSNKLADGQTGVVASQASPVLGMSREVAGLQYAQDSPYWAHTEPVRRARLMSPSRSVSPDRRLQGSASLFESSSPQRCLSPPAVPSLGHSQGSSVNSPRLGETSNSSLSSSGGQNNHVVPPSPKPAAKKPGRKRSAQLFSLGESAASAAASSQPDSPASFASNNASSSTLAKSDPDMAGSASSGEKAVAQPSSPSLSSSSSNIAESSSRSASSDKASKRSAGSRSGRSATKQTRAVTPLEHELPPQWSTAELDMFKVGLARYAKDFRAISDFVGTKNHFECRNLYNNFRFRLHFDDYLEGMQSNRRLVRDGSAITRRCDRSDVIYLLIRYSFACSPCPKM